MTRDVQALGCRVGGDVFWLIERSIRAVYRSDRVRWAEGDSGQAGWLADGGVDLPVYRLSQRLFGAARAAHADRHVVVVDDGARRPWALLVERVVARSRIAADDIAPVPPIARRHHDGAITQLLRADHGFVPLVAPERLDPLGCDARVDRPPVAAFVQRRHVRSAGPMPSQNKILVFSAADRFASDRLLTFALSTAQVHEIVTRPEPLSIPGAASWVRGIVAWRGRAVPLVDLGARLGLESIDRAPGRLLVARGARTSDVIGLEIRRDMRLEHLPLGAARSRSAGFAHPMVLGAFDGGEDTLILLDVDALLEAGSMPLPRFPVPSVPAPSIGAHPVNPFAHDAQYRAS